MKSIAPLVDERELAEAQTAFNTVFASFDPFGVLFQPTIQRRAVLELSGHAIDNWTWESLVKFAIPTGDEIAYFSVTDKFTGICEFPHHIAVPLTKKNPYTVLDGYAPFTIMEHSIYSPAGRWGVITSHENHAVIGGPSEFVERIFSDSHQSEKEHQNAILGLWVYNRDKLGSDISWMPSFLSHLYGKEEAKNLLTEHGLD